jgi:hypothetical protein
LQLDKTTLFMNRREALRLLATGVAIPLANPPLLAAMREARALLHAQPDAQPAARSLNAHQVATVRTMAELILPKTDTPGATDVGVTEFIDLLLTEWYDEPQRAIFLNGLSDVDTRARSLFGKDFVDASPLEQADILTALGGEMTEAAARLRDQPRHGRGAAPTLTHNFYSLFRRLTLTAYYTSDAGATAELHFEIIPERHAGCVEVGTGKGPESQ